MAPESVGSVAGWSEENVSGAAGAGAWLLPREVPTIGAQAAGPAQVTPCLGRGVLLGNEAVASVWSPVGSGTVARCSWGTRSLEMETAVRGGRG